MRIEGETFVQEGKGVVVTAFVVELVRLFVKAGVRVDVVMTAGACRFVTPMTLQALSGRPVLTDLGFELS